MKHGMFYEATSIYVGKKYDASLNFVRMKIIYALYDARS